MDTIFGTKIGMTTIFDDAGNATPVTVVKVLENTVVTVKNKEKDGYDAVQVGVGNKKRLTKPLTGHVKKAGIIPRFLREIRGVYEVSDGGKINLDIFSKGDLVKVSGTSKGKGFAGTVKRHNFKTGPKSHGSHNYRKPGSIGTMYPEHVLKGKKMAGRMGADKVTTKNLLIAGTVEDKNLLLIKGAIPGPNRGLIKVTKTKSAPESKAGDSNE